MKDLENLYAARGAIAARAAPAPEGAPRISANDQVFRIGDQVLPDPLNVIVVAEALLNVYYTEGYDPHSSSPPACFAVGPIAEFGEDGKILPDTGEDAMHAHPTSPDIQGGTDNHDCRTCEMNAFGSAEVGRGKACANRRVLAVVMADDPAFNDGQDLRWAILALPPTALTLWGKYIANLNKIVHRPPEGVITSFSFNKNDRVEQKRKAVVPISYLAISDVGMARKVLALREEILSSKVLQRPMPVTVQETPAKKAKPARGNGKTPAKAAKKGGAPAAKGGATRAKF